MVDPEAITRAADTVERIFATDDRLAPALAADGTFDSTYAATNADEYRAEGKQSYPARNLTAEPADGVHGPIDTRAELQAADPALVALIDDRLNGLTLPPQCR